MISHNVQNIHSTSFLVDVQEVITRTPTSRMYCLQTLYK